MFERQKRKDVENVVDFVDVEVFIEIGIEVVCALTLRKKKLSLIESHTFGAFWRVWCGVVETVT